MKKIFTLFICCYFIISCTYSNYEEPKKCNCTLQEYERTVILKNDHDGTYTDYSDTGWVAKGDPQKDSSVDCSRNGTEKNKDFSSSYDSQYRWDVYRKWMYDCK
jgi:hypothetical protein